MADISKIVVPSGDEYDIKDSTSRSGLADKMDKANPTGTGSFSLNRKANTTIGGSSFAEGYNTTASGLGSHAEGQNTTASGRNAHAEGFNTTASGDYSHAEGFNTAASNFTSHAEGQGTTASGYTSHAEGGGTTASYSYSHAEGQNTIANGEVSHAEGYSTTASGKYSHAEGSSTVANHKSQHVFGEWNVLDNSSTEATKRGNYVEIVGNGTGTGSTVRSNARTLDWSGNEVLSGTIEATGFGTTLDKEVDRGGVQLTQAQYDALVSAGTVDANTTYFITDANNTTASYAAGVTYDNTSSGLSATNVQGAIDEVAEEIDELQTAIFKISAELTGSTVNINANSWGDSIVDIPLITGYRPIAFYKVYSNSPTNLCVNSFDIEYTSTSKFGRIRLRNLSSSTIAAYAIVSILYLRT